MADIFLSYSRKDSGLMHRLRDDLRRAGFTVWTDEGGLEPGTPSWQDDVEEAIRQAKCVVVILSPDAKQSKWVEIEVSYAEEISLRVFPVLARGDDLTAVLFRLSATQRVDIRENYQNVRTKLIPAIKKHLFEKVTPLPLDPGTMPEPPPEQRVFLRQWKIVVPALLLSILAAWAIYHAWTQPSHAEATPTPVPSTLTPTSTPTPQPTNTTIPPSAPPTLALGEVWTEPKAGIDFVFVPAGAFLMGSTQEQIDAAFAFCQQFSTGCSRDWYTNEAPQHTVVLDAFWNMRTEVSNAQYRRFIEAGGYKQQDFWTEDGWKWRTDNNITQPAYWEDATWNKSDYPVVGVSWYEVVAYANWLTSETGQPMRLPTEAEWEKAARGTDGRIFPWGDEWDGSRLNYCDQNCPFVGAKDKTVDDGFAQTAPVDSYQARGASPYGAWNMAGNVWEWTADWYDAGYYANSPEQNPPGPATGDSRVGRGGSWHPRVDVVRAASRLRLDPDARYSELGFRLVLSPGL